MTINDAAIVDLAQSYADRLMLQRDAHEMESWWVSSFHLVDRRTLNFGAAGSFVKHHSKVKALLRRELCKTGDLTAACRQFPLLLGSEVAPGEKERLRDSARVLSQSDRVGPTHLHQASPRAGHLTARPRPVRTL